jgi:hypothetical protein
MQSAMNLDITQAFGTFRLAGSCQFDRERVRNPPKKWHTVDTVTRGICSVDVLAARTAPPSSRRAEESRPSRPNRKVETAVTG